MKTYAFVFATLLASSSSFSAPGIPAKCEARAVESILTAGNRVCGDAYLSDDEINVFFLRYTPADEQTPRRFDDAHCEIPEVDDGLPSVRFEVEITGDDCTIVSEEDWGV